MKNISLMGRIITKVLEIGHWVAVGLMAAVGICSVAAPGFLKYLMDVEGLKQGGEISVYGFDAMVLYSTGGIHSLALMLYALGAVAIFLMMALIFRNLFLVIKRGEEGSPFQSANVRSLRWIGVLSFAIPLVGVVMSVVLRLVIGAEAAEISMDQSGCVMGILVLCLTQFFIHGAQLEQDVEGLV